MANSDKITISLGDNDQKIWLVDTKNHYALIVKLFSYITMILKCKQAPTHTVEQEPSFHNQQILGAIRANQTFKEWFH